MIAIGLNHGGTHEVQTVVQVFFPGQGIRICAQGETPSQGFFVKSTVDERFAHGHVYRDGLLISEHSIPLTNLPVYLNKKRVVMLALYHALQAAVGAYTPWGALTGIRPSRMVRELMDAGFASEKIIHVLAEPFCVTEPKARLALQVAHNERRVTEAIFAGGGHPVGIYLGLPFCPTRCVYCSFNMAHRAARPEEMAAYVHVLKQECHEKAQQLAQMGGRVSSIYIGGGTPTALPDALLADVLAIVAQEFGAAPEFTVEAGRPDTITQANLDIMKAAGVTRIAINPQTLNDKTLKFIGRGHDAADFFRAFSMARAAGFNLINTDIIVGLPGETATDIRRTMEALATVAPENITVHTLAVKRASLLIENITDYPLPTAQATEEMLAIAAEETQKMGQAPYYLYRQKNMVGMFENVGYARLGQECSYNVGMMAETQTVLGMGAGAVSKFVTGDKISREFNHKNPEHYVRTVRGLADHTSTRFS
ncbi:MAG: coproporphyrinogen dehydrogenase HemZ [Defluviitaleaceae bacterium]|nr:coproporphyrinogen dehydrogenase HemZ [Defluviitaleaceae bacterium]